MWFWDRVVAPAGPRWAVIEKKDSKGQVRFLVRHLDLRRARHRDLARAALVAEPVRPERPAKRMGWRTKVTVNPERSPERIVVGVIDDGCPFAVPWLRKKNASTRIAGLWDQDEEAPAFCDVGGGRPKGFRYGAAIGRKALNELLQTGESAPALYRKAGLNRLRLLGSHGAAVLSQLFATPVVDAPCRPHPHGAPSWDADGKVKEIDSADLVFVQIAQAAAQDSTSAAMLRHLSDGLDYILAHTRRGTTKRLVVNVSSGSSRTLHDGSSALERCMVSWLDRARQKLGHKEVYLVVPVGNTQLEQRHGVLSTMDAQLTLMAPPGCEMAQFVTGRWPTDSKSRLRIDAPGAKPRELGPRQAWALKRGETVVAIAARVPTQDRGLDTLLLALGPTDGHARHRAPAGRWGLTLTRANMPAPGAEFWVSRVQRNPGTPMRGLQADFIDVNGRHRGERWRRPVEHTPEGEGPEPDGPRFQGSISGLATDPGAMGLVTVAAWTGGGLSPPRISSYSPEPRPGGRPVDAAAPVDRSLALAGTTVRGNLPGATQRVTGTSFAAPLVARAIVNGAMPPTASDRKERIPRVSSGMAGSAPATEAGKPDVARLGKWVLRPGEKTRGA